MLLLEWGPLLVRLVQALGRLLLHVLCVVIELLASGLEGCVKQWVHLRERSPRAGSGRYRSDRLELTCDAVAALVAGGNLHPIGSFVVVSRIPVFDEVWVAAHGPAAGEVLARTTNEDGGLDLGCGPASGI